MVQGLRGGKRVDGGDGLMINELIIENLTKVSAVDGCIQRKSFMFYALKRIEATCVCQYLFFTVQWLVVGNITWSLGVRRAFVYQYHVNMKSNILHFNKA